MKKVLPFLIAIPSITMIVSGFVKTPQRAIHPPSSYAVPLAGNGYITLSQAGAQEVITPNGLSNWTDASTIISTYFRLGLTGLLKISVRLKVPSGSSTIKVTINDSDPFYTNLTQSTDGDVFVGTVYIPSTGYVRVDLQGASKTGPSFADVSAIVLSGPAAASDVVFASDPNLFSMSRRGPSLSLNYETPSADLAEWFYDEVTIPVGADKPGALYTSGLFNTYVGNMSGYLGLQAGSERKSILFTVMDPQVGKIQKVKSGVGVITQVSADKEVAGWQSILPLDWKTGATYKFLIHASSQQSGTIFTAWVYTPETFSWRFIATYKHMDAGAYLYHLSSRLENVDESAGWQERSCLYGNQWIKNPAGVWKEITSARIGADSTVITGQRKDYSCGVELQGSIFYLQSGGFFNNFTPYNTIYTRTQTGLPPNINFLSLPQN